jgi:hypothetical protein
VLKQKLFFCNFRVAVVVVVAAASLYNELIINYLHHFFTILFIYLLCLELKSEFETKI